MSDAPAYPAGAAGLGPLPTSSVVRGSLSRATAGPPGARPRDAAPLPAFARVLPRCAAQDDLLAGYGVEAGTDRAGLPVPRAPGPGPRQDPGRFDTERSPPGRRPAHPGSRLPFGIGPRAASARSSPSGSRPSSSNSCCPPASPRFRTTPATAAYGITARPGGPTPATPGRLGADRVRRRKTLGPRERRCGTLRFPTRWSDKAGWVWDRPNRRKVHRAGGRCSSRSATTHGSWVDGAG